MLAPECFAALVIASRAASTSGPVLVGDRRVTDADHLDRDAVGVLHLGSHRAQRSSQRRRAFALGVEEPGPEVALLRAGQPGDRAGSPAERWIRARVWSTESCRWAATSARSSERTRASRSSLRSEESRSSHGPTMNPRPTMPKAAARPTLSATVRLPERSENSVIAATAAAARRPIRR